RLGAVATAAAAALAGAAAAGLAGPVGRLRRRRAASALATCCRGERERERDGDLPCHPPWVFHPGAEVKIRQPCAYTLRRPSRTNPQAVTRNRSQTSIARLAGAA